MNVKELKKLLEEYDDELPIRCAEMFGATIELERKYLYTENYFLDGEDTRFLVIAG